MRRMTRRRLLLRLCLIDLERRRVGVGGGSCFGEKGGGIDTGPEVEGALLGVLGGAGEPEILRVGAGIEGEQDVAVTAEEGQVGEVEVRSCAEGRLLGV